MIRYKITMDDAFGFTPPGHTGVVDYELVGPKVSGAKQVSVWIGNLVAGGTAEPHSHEEEEQVYYVLEGSLNIVIGDQEFETEAGDGSIYFVPPKTSHAVYTLSPNAKILVITSPAVQVK